MAIITTYTADTVTSDDDRFLTSDSSGATKLTSGATLKNYILPDSGVTTAKIQDDAVTAAKMLNGLVKKRVGGSSSSWETTGGGVHDTSAADVKIQTGAAPAAAATTHTITFPEPFTQVPLVIPIARGTAGTTPSWYLVDGATSTTSFQFRSNSNVAAFNWIAIGV